MHCKIIFSTSTLLKMVLCAFLNPMSACIFHIYKSGYSHMIQQMIKSGNLFATIHFRTIMMK